MPPPTPQAMLRDASAALRHALDPVSWAADKLDWRADAWQQSLLSSTAANIVVACCRQAGKSSTTAIRAAHIALHEPGSLVLIASPTLRQASEMTAKCRSVLTAPKLRTKLAADAATSITLPNRSRIVSLPATPDACRGFSSPRAVIIDEAAFCEDDLFLALRPMAAAAPRCQFILLSTFNMRNGFFWDAMQSEDWERYKVTAHQVPRISQAFLDAELRDHGEAYFAREYLCEPIEGAFAFFGHDILARCFDCDEEPLTNVRLFT